MRILISTEEGSQFLYYQTIVKALCDRGHNVFLVFAKHIPDDFYSEAEKFRRTMPNFQYGHSFYRKGLWRKVLCYKRAALNYRHFLILNSQNKISSFYPKRMRRYLPPWAKPLVWLPLFNLNFFVKSSLFGKVLNYLEYSAPPPADIVAQLKFLKPDIVVVSPGNIPSSTPDPDYQAAAEYLKIPTIFFTVSWDNLETKGKIHRVADYTFVWNKIQKRAAENNHGVPAETIHIVGAPFFDRYFGDLRISAKEAFFSRHGLDPARPYLLYMGSTPIYRGEIDLLRLFRKILDESGDPELKKIQIVARPHPASNSFFKNLKPNEAVLQKGELPKDRESFQLFYDTIYHSLAVVGVCTSGFIPVFIVGKPVISMPTEKYKHIHEQAPHFKQLLESNVVDVANSGEEFLKIVRGLMSGHDQRKPMREKFVRDYVRPVRLDKDAGAAFADIVEKLFK